MRHRAQRRRHGYRPPWNPYALGIIWGSAFGVFLCLACAVAVLL